MFNDSEALVTFSIFLIAVGVLAWGFVRSKSYGKLGILAWLQSVVLMVPWLLFFALYAAGIYLNIVGILLLLVTSVGIYIYLGRRLRAAGQDVILKERAAQRLQTEQKSPTQSSQTDTANQVNQSTPNSEQQTQTITPEVSPIAEEDLQVIQGIFGIDTFFSTETISYQEGAIFKGNLRGEPEQVYERLSNNLVERLGEKYRLFLVESPEGKPVVIILPSSDDPQPATTPQKVLAVILIIATIATTLEASGLLMSFDLFSDFSRYGEALPLSTGLWAILATHEIGHQIMAKRYNIRLSIPFFLPSLQVGALGAITRFESLIPSRQALFDVSFAGVAAGGVISLLMLMAGLILSHPGSEFQIPTGFFQGSILVGTLAKVVLGDSLQNSLVDVHPLTVVGWLGLVITALNLMPAGQLDGGRIIQAIYGRKMARRATITTLIVIGLIALVNPANPIPLYWGIIIIFLQRNLERPTLNELTEPDDARAALGLFALLLMLVTLIPLSPSLASSLGIGS